MNVVQEIKNIKAQIKTIILNSAKDKQCTNYDLEAGRVNTSKAQRSADDANVLTRENEAGIMDVASVASENDGAIVELAEYISNLEERITILEGGNE